MSESDLLEDIAEADAVRMFGVPLTEEDRVLLSQLAVTWKTSPQEAMVKLLRRTQPSQNGHAGFKVRCSGPCGTEFTRSRRPIPGQRVWCDACKASGEPAAQRARDYRARRDNAV